MEEEKTFTLSDETVAHNNMVGSMFLFIKNINNQFTETLTAYDLDLSEVTHVFVICKNKASGIKFGQWLKRNCGGLFKMSSGTVLLKRMQLQKLSKYICNDPFAYGIIQNRSQNKKILWVDLNEMEQTDGSKYTSSDFNFTRELNKLLDERIPFHE